VSQQWIGLFKKLPVGILVTTGNEVLHNNKKMKDITGIDNIKVQATDLPLT
jgi:hypothetical protein